MDLFRLDRQAFNIQSFDQASKKRSYWMKKTARVRLAAAWYLICTAYQLKYDDKHRLDRTVFNIRQRTDG